MTDEPRKPEDETPERPSATWRWWEGALVFVASYLVGDLLRIPLGGPEASEIARTTGRALVELSWVVGILLWLGARHPRWREVMVWPRRPWREVHEGAVFGFILYGVVALAVALPVSWMLTRVSGEQVQAPRQLSYAMPAIGLAIGVIFSLVISPVAEELFFRGVLFRALADQHGPGVGIAGSAAAFALVHVVPGSSPENLVTVAATLGMGIGLAILYQRRQNILAPVAAHAAFNLLGLVVLLRA